MTRVAWLAALCPKDAVTKDLLVFFVTFVIFVAGFSWCAS